MQLLTSECVLTDLLNCGYADLDMLDGLYDTIGDEMYRGNDRYHILLRAVNEDGLNSVLHDFYSDVTVVVSDKIKELIKEYKEAEDKKDTSLVLELSYTSIFYDEDDNFTPLTEEQIKLIETKAEEMKNSTPFCNCLDTHFQNDLDETFDSEDSVLTNAVNLIKYWLE